MGRDDRGFLAGMTDILGQGDKDFLAGMTIIFEPMGAMIFGAE